MPVRVGFDLVEVASVAAALRAHPERYLQRVYTGREVGECRDGDGVDARRLAARFAAKEAALKVLRPDGEAIPLRFIEVRSEPSGRVELHLSGPAAERAAHEHIAALALTVAHDGGLASAVVVATCSQAPSARDRSWEG
jgi:holo-[acyl-carrier protein] synthase